MSYESMQIPAWSCLCWFVRVYLLFLFFFSFLLSLFFFSPMFHVNRFLPAAIWLIIMYNLYSCEISPPPLLDPWFCACTCHSKVAIIIFSKYCYCTILWTPCIVEPVVIWHDYVMNTTCPVNRQSEVTIYIFDYQMSTYETSIFLY